MDHPKNDAGENICYAALENGRRCKLPAGLKTEHEGFGKCSLHGGNTPMLVKNAAMYAGGEIIARQSNAAYGGPVDIGPHDALLQEVRAAAGHVAWIRDRIGLWDLSTEAIPEDEKQYWMARYDKERLMLTKIAKTAIDAGVAEAKVKLAQDQSAIIVAVLRNAFDGLNLTVQQQRLLPGVVSQAIRSATQPDVQYQIPQTGE